MLEKVIGILAEFTEAGADSIKGDSRLIVDLGLSSLDVVNLIVAFEEEFGIEVPDEDISGFATVEDIVKCIEQF